LEKRADTIEIRGRFCVLSGTTQVTEMPLSQPV
jgi:hypothetical protein